MLVFDFDGVLIDSVETLVTAYNTATGGLIRTLAELPNGFESLFKKNRCRAPSAGELALLGEWCLTQTGQPSERLLTRAEFEALAEASPRTVRQLADSFFAARAEFSEADHEAWVALNMPYQPLWDGLRQRDAGEVVIMTFKNRRAVLEICTHYGLAVKAENVYSGDNGTGKIENLARIRQRFADQKLSYVDDSVLNLRELKQYFEPGDGGALLHADWGYVGPEDVEAAKREGFRVVGQEGLLELIDGGDL